VGCCGGSRPMFPTQRAVKSSERPINDPRAVSGPSSGVAPTVPSDKGLVANLIEAGATQERPLSWFLDGASKLAKCILKEPSYPDHQIRSNREACKNCIHSTKNTAGKVTTLSQCMAPDPAKDGAKCGCFILCKTQVGECPLKLWDLTISATTGVLNS